MKNIKRLIYLRIIVAVILLVGVIAGGRKLVLRKKAILMKSPKFELNAKPVETVPAVQGDLKEGHDYLALIEPLQSANISAQVTGVILSVHKDEGDVVSTGDLLAALDDRQVRDNIAIIEAQMEQARAEEAVNIATLESFHNSSQYWAVESKRDESLAEKETIPRSTAQATAEKYNEARGRELSTEKKILSIQKQVLALQRKVDELKTTLAYYLLKSPFDGVVSAKLVDEGDLALPGKILFTVEDRSALKLSFDLPQTDLPAFKEGLSALFSFNNKEYTTSVTLLFPKLNRARMLHAEAAISESDAADLPLGAYVTLSVEFTRIEKAVLIPVGAVVESRHYGSHVFTVHEGTLSRRPVTVLGSACETAAVEGIKAGEEVVIHSFLGWARLADGMKVEAK